MMGKLLLLFTVVPAFELWLLIQLGQWIGAFETALLIVCTGGLGAFLAKREGLGVLRALQAELTQGIPPGERLVEGLLVLVGGVLLITPGVLTDLTGFLLIMPWSRRWLAPRVQRWAMKRLLPAEGGGSFMGGSVTFGSPRVARTREPLRPSADEASFPHPTPRD
jgi:UPF0716 protein FxsA